MSSKNTFGRYFTLQTFGESHGAAIGGIIDGCPSQIYLDIPYIQQCLNRRKPSLHKSSTTRKEEDEVQFLSGLFEGQTLGTPIAFQIQNSTGSKL